MSVSGPKASGAAFHGREEVAVMEAGAEAAEEVGEAGEAVVEAPGRVAQMCPTPRPPTRRTWCEAALAPGW